jgi:hypothetical protein
MEKMLENRMHELAPQVQESRAIADVIRLLGVIKEHAIPIVKKRSHFDSLEVWWYKFYDTAECIAILDRFPELKKQSQAHKPADKYLWNILYSKDPDYPQFRETIGMYYVKCYDEHTVNSQKLNNISSDPIRMLELILADKKEEKNMAAAKEKEFKEFVTYSNNLVDEWVAKDKLSCNYLQDANKTIAEQAVKIVLLETQLASIKASISGL